MNGKSSGSPQGSATGRQPGVAVEIIAVFIVCALIPLVLGSVLGWPARTMRGLFPDVTCTNFVPGSAGMYVCSMMVGLMAIIGPVLVMVVIFMLRKPLYAAIPRVNERLPEYAQFILAPAVATAAFTMSWAGYHVATWNKMGLMPHSMFPVVVGVFTYLVARFGPQLGHSMGPFFESRDKVPRFLRYLLVLGIPLTIALVITYQERVTNEAIKEQFIVMVALVVAYLLVSPHGEDGALAPRDGAYRGGTMARMSGWLTHAIPVGIMAEAVIELALPDTVFAHDCSNEADCQQTPGYNAATGVGGGMIGAGAGLLGVQMPGGSGSGGLRSGEAGGGGGAALADANAPAGAGAGAAGAAAVAPAEPTVRIIDGTAATNWMVNEGLLDRDGTPTPLFTAWQNQSGGDPNATRLQAFAGNINPDTGRVEGDLAIVVRDPDVMLHDRPPAPAGDAAVVVTENYAPGVDITGTHQFIEQTRLHLQSMGGRPSGEDLTRRLGIEAVGNNHRVNIVETHGGNSADFGGGATLEADGSRGDGGDVTVRFNPYRHSLPGAHVLPDGSPDPADWRNRPPQVGLQHELNHAYHGVTGQIDTTPVPNPELGNNVPAEEMRTLGIGPYGSSGIDENVARLELNLPLRPHY